MLGIDIVSFEKLKINMCRIAVNPLGRVQDSYYLFICLMSASLDSKGRRCCVSLNALIIGMSSTIMQHIQWISLSCPLDIDIIPRRLF